MKRITSVIMLLLACVLAKATPTITTIGDTLVITVNGAGDLAKANFTAQQLASTNIKLITANSYKLSTTDMQNFFGIYWGSAPTFSLIKNLDLSQINVSNEVDMGMLHNCNTSTGKLIMPESLTTLPTNQYNDSNFKWTELVFPNASNIANVSKTTLPTSIFNGITSLKTVLIGSCVNSIGQWAFNNCSNLTTLDFHDGVKKLDTQAFVNCTGLTRVILPKTITEIGQGAFESCSNLTAVRLPNNLEYIRTGAFNNCTKLTEITIPASTLLIENGAFNSCTGLTDVYVLGTQTKCQNNAFEPTNLTYGYSYSGTGKGETVDLSAFSPQYGKYLVLHYPEAAYDTYVNRYTRLIGTDAYNSQTVYPSWDNKWVFDKSGNKLPVLASNYFDNQTAAAGDYAGWWNFMLVSKLKDIVKDERLIEGKWYSVCFPFDLDEGQIGSAFGPATEICEFSGAHIKKDATTGKDYFSLEFKTPVTKMKAHHPYMIHPGVHSTNYNMIMDAIIDTDTQNDNFASKLAAESVTQTDEKGNVYTFIGNHTAGALVPMYSYYYYSGPTTTWPNAFYKSLRSDVTFTPNTAVIVQKKDNNISGAKISFYSNDDLSETTGISEIQTPQTVQNKTTSHNVYNVYGQLVRQGTDSLEGLPAGIYIVNGKKYIK